MNVMMLETVYCHVSTNVNEPPHPVDLIAGTSYITTDTGKTAASTLRFQVPRSTRIFDVFNKNFSFSSKHNPSLS